jgi:hypothetical protein
MIDYHQGIESDGLPQVIAALKARPYVWGKHFAPHDIKATERGTGKTLLETARGLGWNFLEVPDIGVDNGINAGRLLFPRLWADASKCSLFLDAAAQLGVASGGHVPVCRGHRGANGGGRAADGQGDGAAAGAAGWRGVDGMKQPRYTLTLRDLSVGDVLTLQWAAESSPSCQKHAQKAIKAAADEIWREYQRHRALYRMHLDNRRKLRGKPHA